MAKKLYDEEDVEKVLKERPYLTRKVAIAILSGAGNKELGGNYDMAVGAKLYFKRP